MTKPARSIVLAAMGGGAMASVLTLGITSDFAVGASPNANPNSNGNANATPNPKTLQVAVDTATPVAPGRAGTVTVKVTNPNAQDVILNQVAGSVTKVSRDDCSKAWFSIGAWSPESAPTVIGGKSYKIVTLPLTFQNTSTNQDACKGVTYEFSIAATGRQA